MDWLYFTRSNGDVDNMPHDKSLTNTQKKRDFIGDQGATNFKIVADEDVVRNAKWDGSKYIDGNPNSGKDKSIERYYQLCYRYQLNNIDANLQSEMDKSESLVEAGKATEDDLPKAKENGDWLLALWTFYYTEKEKLKSGFEYSKDFSSLGNVPHSFSDVRSERKNFLSPPIEEELVEDPGEGDPVEGPVIDEPDPE